MNSDSLGLASLVPLLAARRHRWLVTGAAGFIGSNLVEALLALGQDVVGLDNFSTGFARNVDEVRQRAGTAAAKRFDFIEADINDIDRLRAAMSGCEYVLHQAALGSVPRSIAEPLKSYRANVDGFMQVLEAARAQSVARVVYASSSSVYGDSAELPKIESRVGQPLSPYAATKAANELFAATWARSYGCTLIGLRYFNVFGQRQDPNGAYAAVIPRWSAAMLNGKPIQINGDGLTSRDFCYIANVVQANLRAALAPAVAPGSHAVLNVACGARTTLNELFRSIRAELAHYEPAVASVEPRFGDFRAGDVRHSLADFSQAGQLIGYKPTHLLADGLALAMPWYVQMAKRA